MEREMGLAGFGWDRVPPVKMVGLISEHRPNNSAGHDDDVKCFDGDAIGDAIGRRANGDEKCFRWSFVICAHMRTMMMLIVTKMWVKMRVIVMKTKSRKVSESQSP